MKFRDVKGESMASFYETLIGMRDKAYSRAYTFPEGSEQRAYYKGLGDGLDDVLSHVKLRWGDC